MNDLFLGALLREKIRDNCQMILVPLSYSVVFIFFPVSHEAVRSHVSREAVSSERTNK